MALRPRRGSCVPHEARTDHFIYKSQNNTLLNIGIARYQRYRCSTAQKASWSISTLPIIFARFLPSFCFSSSFFFRVMSPPPTVYKTHKPYTSAGRHVTFTMIKESAYLARATQHIFAIRSNALSCKNLAPNLRLDDDFKLLALQDLT